MSMPVIVHQRWCAASRDTPLWARSLLAISGSLFALMGAILAAAGVFATSDGSTFYMLAGLGLIASGTPGGTSRASGPTWRSTRPWSSGRCTMSGSEVRGSCTG